MPIPVVSSNPAIIWDEVWSFPALRIEDVLPIAPGFPMGRMAQSVGGVLRENSQTQRYSSLTNQTAGPAGATYRTPAAGGPPVWAIGSNGIGQFIAAINAFRTSPDIGSGNAVAEGATLTSRHRVWWLKWLMASPTVNTDARNGLLLIPRNNHAQVAWPNKPVGIDNGGGFGFNGDGAGNWQYSSYDRTGVLLAREQLPLPAHTMSDRNQFEIVIINARPGFPATVDFYFNGALLWTRNWAGADLEPYAANEWRYEVVLSGGNAAAALGETEFSDMEMRRGRFTRDGVEL